MRITCSAAISTFAVQEHKSFSRQNDDLEQIAMRTCADENKLIFGKLINEQPVSSMWHSQQSCHSPPNQMRPVPGSQWSSASEDRQQHRAASLSFCCVAGLISRSNRLRITRERISASVPLFLNKKKNQRAIQGFASFFCLFYSRSRLGIWNAGGKEVLMHNHLIHRTW